MTMILRSRGHEGSSEDLWAGFDPTRPGVLRRGSADSIIAPEEMWRSLAQAAADGMLGRVKPVRCFVDGALLMSADDRLLPTRADGSLAGHLARVQRETGAEDVLLITYSYQLYDALGWLRLRRIMHPLFSRIGCPTGRADLDVFVGRYDRTPTGVHRDAATNFSFLVEGRKTMLFWEPSALHASAGSTPEASSDLVRVGWEWLPFADKATRIVATAGDVIHWPAGWWHIAVGREYACTLSCAFYDSEAPLHLVDEALCSLRANVAAPPREVRLRPGGSQLARAAVERAHDECARWRDMLEDVDLDDAVISRALARASAWSFSPVPPAAALEDVSDEDVVATTSTLPILLHSDGLTTWLAAHGHVLRMPAHPQVAGLVERLNSAIPAVVAELVASHSCVSPDEGGLEAEHIRALLQQLLSMRALHRVAAVHEVPAPACGLES
jgi:50S ribosomal protein L16 3-hydroxylase